MTSCHERTLVVLYEKVCRSVDTETKTDLQQVTKERSLIPQSVNTSCAASKKNPKHSSGFLTDTPDVNNMPP